MKPALPIVSVAAAALLFAAGGCTAFRRIFAGDNILEANRIVDAEEREKEEKRDRQKRRDPVDDMFELKPRRDRTPRHQGLPLTAQERAIFDAAEDSADRDRALIEDEKHRMSSDRKARKDWVFSFKPEQQK